MSDNNSKPVERPKPVFPQDSVVRSDDFIVPKSSDKK